MSILVRASNLFVLSFVALGFGCSALVDTDPGRLGDDELVDAGPGGGDGGDGGGGCGAGCDDGVACTDDSCVGDVCRFVPNDALCGLGERCNPTRGCISERCATNADCDDGNACNGEEVCGGAAPDARTGCSAGTAPTCDDGVPCTSDRCEPGVGCVNMPVDAACDDGVSCTVDTCDPARGCSRTPNDALCDDGVCFEGGRCDPARGCLGAMAINCADGNACTEDFCEPGVGCQNPPRDDDDDGFAVSADGRCGGDDCDDTDPNVYPGAPELCNGEDDDCDGDVDESDECENDLPDDCESATPVVLAANTGSITGTFVGLTDDYDTLCQTSSGMRSAIGGAARTSSPDAIHYVDIPSGNWDVRIDTQGATVDTVLAVARTCGDFDLGGLGCNDDSNLGSTTWSRVWLHRIGSSFSTTRVFLLVEPYGSSATGDYTINVQITTAAEDRCGVALDIRGGGTVIGFGGVAVGAAGQSGSCQGSGSFLEGEHLFFYGAASNERPAVFELYSDTHTPDVYNRFTCNDDDTEGACATGTSIGGGIQRARIQINAGNTVFADGMTGTNPVYSLFYDP
ncbi:MAG: hypothetical protein MUE69_09125 [Myxococcota bacterium]|jgi:hypothetical protein|nr:hypothetical protein [Myxococcota bacterium]